MEEVSVFKRFCLGWVLVLCLTTVGIAQPLEEIGLADFINMALAHNPALVQSNLQLKEARLKQQVALGATKLNVQVGSEILRRHIQKFSSGYPLPQGEYWDGRFSLRAGTYLPAGIKFGVVADWSDRYVVGTDYKFDPFADEHYQVTLQMSRPLFRATDNLSIYQGVRGATQAVTQQELNHVRVEQQVRVEAAQSFYGLWKIQELIGSLGKRMNWAKTQAELLEGQVEAGLAHRIDLQEARLRQRELELDLNIANQNLLLQKEALAQTLSINLPDRFVVHPGKVDRSTVQEFIPLSAISPDIALAHFQYEAAIQALQQAQDQGGLQGEVQGNISDDRNWTIKVAFQYPLFDSRMTTNQLAVAKLQVEQARSHIETTTFSVQQRKAENMQRITNATSRLDLAKEGLVLAEKRWKIVQERDTLGAVSFGERYSGMEQLEVSYLRLIDATIEYHLSQLHGQIH